MNNSESGITTLPVDILLHVGRHVEVHDVLDVVDVEAAGRHRRRHDDRRLADLEPAECLLPLPLGPVAVDAGDWEALPVEELVQAVGAPLGLHEDEGPAGLGVQVLGAEPGGVHQVQQEGLLVVLLHPHHLGLY